MDLEDIYLQVTSLLPNNFTIFGNMFLSLQMQL